MDCVQVENEREEKKVRALNGISQVERVKVQSVVIGLMLKERMSNWDARATLTTIEGLSEQRTTEQEASQNGEAKL